MKIGVSTIAYNQVEPLKDLVRTAHQTGHEVEMRIFVHSRLPKVIEICLWAEKEYGAILHMFGVNRGVATSWNDALIKMRDSGCDVSILSNDDLWFSDGDIDKIAAAAVQHRNAYAIFCSGYHVGYDTPIGCHGMSCFAMQPKALEEVGFYDENFFPAYNEDVDYARRVAMAGLKPIIVRDTNVYHIGSAAIKADPNLANQNHATHGMNNIYWKSKWGCPVTEDPNPGYRHPFNNHRHHPFFIGQEERHEPYPAYNRTDKHIVRL